MQAANSIDIAYKSQSRSAPVVIGAVGIICILAGLAAWSAVAPLASAVMAAGTVVVAENVKTVQSLEGGLVQAVMVHDGDAVKAGQELIRFESKSQKNVVMSLEFSIALNDVEQRRLRAEISGDSRVRFSPSPEGDVEKPVYDSMIKDQEDVFRTQVGNQLLHQGEILNERTGYEAALQGVELEELQVRRRLALANEDTETSSTLARLGSGTMKARRDFEAASAVLLGDFASLNTRQIELQQQIKHCELESQRLVLSFREASQLELQKLISDKQELKERLVQASINLAQTVIRSPVDGDVINEGVHTIGGIVLPGAQILEIVPSGQKLIIESQIRPSDVNDVAIGATVIIRSEGKAPQALSSTSGRVVSISADRIFDPNKNEPYFLIRIELDRAQMLAATGIDPRPGIPLEVMIMKQSETLFDYLTSPLVSAFAHSMRD